MNFRAAPFKMTTTKRFGARYGSGVKHDFDKIEALHRKKYKCPYCHNHKVKRVSAGIWQCRKCNAKFAGKAYTISKKIAVKETEKLKEKIIEKPGEAETAEESAEPQKVKETIEKEETEVKEKEEVKE